MKTNGLKKMTRKIDLLGRITLPNDYRTALGVTFGDAMDISLDNDKIIITKFKTLENSLSELVTLIDLFAKCTNQAMVLSDLGQSIYSTENKPTTDYSYHKTFKIKFSHAAHDITLSVHDDCAIKNEASIEYLINLIQAKLI